MKKKIFLTLQKIRKNKRNAKNTKEKQLKSLAYSWYHKYQLLVLSINCSQKVLKYNKAKMLKNTHKVCIKNAGFIGKTVKI